MMFEFLSHYYYKFICQILIFHTIQWMRLSAEQQRAMTTDLLHLNFGCVVRFWIFHSIISTFLFWLNNSYRSPINHSYILIMAKGFGMPKAYSSYHTWTHSCTYCMWLSQMCVTQRGERRIIICFIDFLGLRLMRRVWQLYFSWNRLRCNMIVHSSLHHTHSDAHSIPVEQSLYCCRWIKM